MRNVIIAGVLAVVATASAYGASEECRDDRLMDVLESDKSVDALNVRAWRYYNGVGVPADRKIAVEFWREAAKRGSARAVLRLGQPWPHAESGNIEYKTDFDRIAEAAEKNDPLAMVVYGRAQIAGQMGGASDVRRGLMMLEVAAGRGSVWACVSLAEFYGREDRKRPAEQKLWAERAMLSAKKYAKTLGTEEMTTLGVFLLTDISGKKDVALGRKWLADAAQLGDPVAMYQLADSYAGTTEKEASQEVVEKDRALARQWGSAAVRGGYGRANILLAYLQLSGQGGEKDPEYAVELLAKPIESGYLEAKHMLGMMYLTGQGVRVNTWRAEKLLTEAAESGYVPAMWDLVRIYRDGGMGLTRDQEKGAMWLQRAYEKGHPEAKAAVERFSKQNAASMPTTRP